MTEPSAPNENPLSDGPVESLGRIRAQGIALLVLALVVGAVAGAALMRLHDRGRARGLARGRVMLMRGRDGVPPAFDELGLSSDQRAKIRAILVRRRPRTDSILREMLPKLRAVTDSTRGEIRGVLTPAQRAKMDSLFGRERRLRGMRGMRPFGGGGRAEGEGGGASGAPASGAGSAPPDSAAGAPPTAGKVHREGPMDA